MIVRSTLYTSPGGDTVQIDLTAKHLRELGVNVDIKYTNSEIAYKNYQAIHFFNIIRPDDIFPHIKNNLPVFISTIFVDYSEYERSNREGILGYAFKFLSSGQIEYLKAIARWVKNGEAIKSKFYFFNGHKASIKFLMGKASLLLPNSHNEYQRLAKYSGRSAPYRKVVNAIDPSIFNNDIPANDKFSNHIICVGRIEGRKNQLNLIKAMAKTSLQLTIIGKPSPNHINYYQECKKLADQCGNVKFIDHLDHHELVGIYKAAKVHVLPSWFETTGLSSLEAGVMGCNIVITKKGDTEEYFKDFAFYCDPGDVDSISSAIMNAYHAPINGDLRSYIINYYTWQEAAKQTYQAYRSVFDVS